MITLYQYEVSPFCDKIRRVLNYKGLEYETVDYSIADTAKGALKKYNSIGKVPTIKAHGAYLGDSTDIAQYLEKKHPEPALMPNGPKEKAMVHVLEDWADESLYFTEMYLRFNISENRNILIPELTKLDGSALKMLAPLAVPFAMKKLLNNQGIGRKALPQVLADLERHVSAIESWLGNGNWLVGKHITLADISVYSQLNCINQTPEGSKLIDKKPSVVAWLERVASTTEKKEAIAA